MNLTLVPSLDADRTAAGLERLLVSGIISDPHLERRAARLERHFRSYLLACPAPLWAPGLRIDREWRTVTETFLPWSDLAPAFRCLMTRSLRYPPRSDPLATPLSWPDFLDRLPPGIASANPATLFRSLMADDTTRRRWLFSLFLPKEHGNGFDRYPVQREFLAGWLHQRRGLPLSCLDSACGSGEGTWELAELFRKNGYLPSEVSIHGSSLDHLELFAAAHAFFPHDRDREARYRSRIFPLLAGGFADRITFEQEDLADSCGAEERYDLIICNGLLGGPLLHGRAELEEVVAGLVRRLRPEGLFLASDRFHEGWHKLIPVRAVEEILAGAGLKVLDVDEGVAGEKR